MRFQPGDETDQNLCRTLTHEYLRCSDAFAEFVSAAQQMTTGNEDRRVSYRAYNAYARFILHLYEFLFGCLQRELGDTSVQPKGEKADPYIAERTQRAMRIYRIKLTNVSPYAVPFDPSATELDSTVNEFARDFRQFRNTVMGHVKHQRAALSLSDFYRKHHEFLAALYASSLHMWGGLGAEFPDLGEITAFSVVVKSEPPKPVG